jgi:hypothetical protein
MDWARAVGLQGFEVFRRWISEVLFESVLGELFCDFDHVSVARVFREN